MVGNSSIASGSSITSSDFSFQDTEMSTPRKILANVTLNSSQFKLIALKYKENIEKINSKMEYYKGKNKKKLFSLYRVFDYEKNDYVSMMHVYKRNLSPIKENYAQCNQTSPFEDNFVTYSNSFVQSHFKQEYLNIHDNVHVTTKFKHFQTFSVVSQKQEKQPQSIKTQQTFEIQKQSNRYSDNNNDYGNSPINNQNDLNSTTKSNMNFTSTSAVIIKKSNFKDNIQRLKEARGKSTMSPEIVRKHKAPPDANRSFNVSLNNQPMISSQKPPPPLQMNSKLQQHLQQIPQVSLNFNSQQMIHLKKQSIKELITQNDPTEAYLTQMNEKQQQQQQTIQSPLIIQRPASISSQSSVKRISVHSIKASEDIENSQEKGVQNQQQSSDCDVIIKTKKLSDVSQRKFLLKKNQIQSDSNQKDNSLFLYNPADSVPNPDFESLKGNVYTAIFNYKEPLNKAKHHFIRKDSQRISASGIQSIIKENYDEKQQQQQQQLNKNEMEKSTNIKKTRSKCLSTQNSMVETSFVQQDYTPSATNNNTISGNFKMPENVIRITNKRGKRNSSLIKGQSNAQQKKLHLNKSEIVYGLDEQQKIIADSSSKIDKQDNSVKNNNKQEATVFFHERKKSHFSNHSNYSSKPPISIGQSISNTKFKKRRGL